MQSANLRTILGCPCAVSLAPEPWFLRKAPAVFAFGLIQPVWKNEKLLLHLWMVHCAHRNCETISARLKFHWKCAAGACNLRSRSMMRPSQVRIESLVLSLEETAASIRTPARREEKNRLCTGGHQSRPIQRDLRWYRYSARRRFCSAVTRDCDASLSFSG